MDHLIHEEIVTYEPKGRGRVPWTESSTKLLLSLYKEYEGKIGKSMLIKNKSKLWPLLQKIINERLDTEYTEKQVENKFTTLIRSFKDVMDNNKRTGRGRKTSSYQIELEELFAKKPSISPQCVISFQTVEPAEKIEEELNVNHEEEPNENENMDEEAQMEEAGGVTVTRPNTSTESDETIRKLHSGPIKNRKRTKTTLSEELRAFRVSKEKAAKAYQSILSRKNDLLNDQNELLRTLIKQERKTGDDESCLGG